MPIKIYTIGNPKDEVAWLCDGEWRLPKQIGALESWLEEARGTLKSGRYIADIGFSVPNDAGGGGSALSPETMRIMADLGIELWLSEYPSDESAA